MACDLRDPLGEICAGFAFAAIVSSQPPTPA